MFFLAICCLFKFYLLPAFLLLGIFKWKRSILNLLFVAVISVLSVLNLKTINKTFFPTSWESSFGPGALKSLITMYGLTKSPFVIPTISIVLILTVGFICYRSTVISESEVVGISAWVFLISSITYIFSLLFVTSYSYRLFLIMLTLPFIFVAVKSKLFILIFKFLSLVGFYLNNPQGLGTHDIHLILILSGISQLSLLILGGMLLGLSMRHERVYVKKILTWR